MVASGAPVLVWTTRAFSPSLYNYTFQLANGSWPYSNSHCLVLTGYDDETCYLATPCWKWNRWTDSCLPSDM